MSVTPIKRACDACHRRKVRCSGGLPCRNCRQTSLSCTYNAIPQKKGPKGSRAKVISGLRETQRQDETTLNMQQHFCGFDSSPGSPALLKTPGLLTQPIIDGCINSFFLHMHPTMPILDRDLLHLKTCEIGHSPEMYCMISSLCAFIMIQPGLPANLRGGTENTFVGDVTMGRSLLEDTLRVRKSYNYIDLPSTNTVITSFFLFACYFGLDKHNTAWFYLREATTLAEILEMHLESTYVSEDLSENARRRRLFWLLFVTERAYALQRHRPLTLHDTIDLPTAEEEPREAAAVAGFRHLVNLFRPFDDIFVGLWNKARHDCSTAWLAQLQQQLSDALPDHLDATESQAADLRTTASWLKTMVWQLSITNGYLSSRSPDASMTFTYPIQIAKDLAANTVRLSQQSMEVHGVGLVEKLFDIACTLTDVMACVPLEPSAFEIGPRDSLHQFLALISTLRGGESRFMPLLLAKVNEVLPTMTAPIPHPLLGSDDNAITVEEIFEESTPQIDTTFYQTPPLSLANTLAGDSPIYYNVVNSPGASVGPDYPDMLPLTPLPRSVPQLPLTTNPS